MSESNSRCCLFRAIHWRDRPLAHIFTKYAVASSVLPAMAALALQSAPAIAQEQPRTQSVEIFGGEAFGDKLTEAPVSGRNPRLNDDALAGIRFTANAGIGVKYYVSSSLYVNALARYRYLDRPATRIST